ncbi:MAG: TonB-dependent receptor [Chlorobi bacterium]|nr:MAG: TonB-dependent receptor plug domain-containing protein [Bacteroidota bacterium]KXK34060.1 MAG: Fe(3+) dicitrate transport protein FecA precursor [Chlorobi bacterium OLB6]MBE2265138.1 TonB-dependent receptor [Flavobacteriales bacterium]MBL1161345.1 TonB-dependent receptor [Chlorobiota bacterium]MBW7852632.1 TonB-dependent receptor [Candidatus Kapabacteria bacterium]MCC6331108.1 TonB-dependent receptor [Ignavibacteria bacterium]
MNIGKKVRNTLISVGLVVLVVYQTAGNTLSVQSADADDADTVTLRKVSVSGNRSNHFIISPIDDVGIGVINAGKKVELIYVQELPANTATNNARQVFAGIAGLNVWESDALGLQLGIGGRGLSPSRSSNFTTRQNGYDIAADPLGYPESYYTPPMEMVERINIVRGGGALRYGTQFGGMVNFGLLKPNRSSALHARVSAGTGSYGLVHGSLVLSGAAKGLDYQGWMQYRRTDGWRSNSTAYQGTGHTHLAVSLSDYVRITAEFTGMHYLAQEPGGLSDKMFDTNPKQSVRARNWFTVNWNIASVGINAILDTATTLNSIFSGMKSSRTALGDLNRITMIDMGGPRTMIDGKFINICNETTLTHQYRLFNQTSAIAVGTRLYWGSTEQQQGDASSGSGPDFAFLNPDALEGSSYDFPITNAAIFAEGLVSLGGGFSVIPGLRLERIDTRAHGWYRTIIRDLAGNRIVDTVTNEERSRNRVIMLGGLGVQWRSAEGFEVYANAVQNYRAITFTDLRVVNPNLIVDQDIHDERGYTLDVGSRGQFADILAWDISVFYLRYNDKIGEVTRSDQPPLYLPYRYRTNIADAFTQGVECVADINILNAWSAIGISRMDECPLQLHLLLNASVLGGSYEQSAEQAVTGKAVEFVPPYLLRTSIRLEWDKLGCMMTYSQVGQQYTDATNTTHSASAVTGVIPEYSVIDFSATYTTPRIIVRASLNNALDTNYFTRRAASYPGPGIIPSDPRTVALSITANLSLFSR